MLASRSRPPAPPPPLSWARSPPLRTTVRDMLALCFCCGQFFVRGLFLSVDFRQIMVYCDAPCAVGLGVCARHHKPRSESNASEKIIPS
jgi:hypothetical protein